MASIVYSYADSSFRSPVINCALCQGTGNWTKRIQFNHDSELISRSAKHFQHSRKDTSSSSFERLVCEGCWMNFIRTFPDARLDVSKTHLLLHIGCFSDMSTFNMFQHIIRYASESAMYSQLVKQAKRSLTFMDYFNWIRVWMTFDWSYDYIPHTRIRSQDVNWKELAKIFIRLADKTYSDTTEIHYQIFWDITDRFTSYESLSGMMLVLSDDPDWVKREAKLLDGDIYYRHNFLDVMTWPVQDQVIVNDFLYRLGKNYDFDRSNIHFNISAQLGCMWWNYESRRMQYDREK